MQIESIFSREIQRDIKEVASLARNLVVRDEAGHFDIVRSGVVE